MEFISSFFTYILTLPSVVFISVVMFAIVLLLGGGLKKAVRAGTLFAVGITGITLLMGNVTSSLTGIATGLSTRFGLNLNIIDYGYGLANLAFFGKQAFIALAAMFLVDIVMIILGWTKTLWVDVHNSWHGLFWGSISYFITGDFWIALVINLVVFIVFLKLADYTAPTFQKENETPGVAFIAGISTVAAVFAKFIMMVINRIPVLRDIEATPEDIQDKFGVFGEQSVMGMIIGVVLAAFAGLKVPEIIQTGITIAATLTIFPKIAAIVVEGIIPITTTVTGFMKKRFKNRSDLNIAVDGAVLLGNPAVMSTYVLLIPVVILLYVIVPGIGFIPIASLAGLPYIIGGIAPYCKSNVLHTFIVSAIVLVIFGFSAHYVADVATVALRSTGMYTGTATLTAIDEAGNPIGALIKFISQLLAH